MFILVRESTGHCRCYQRWCHPRWGRCTGMSVMTLCIQIQRRVVMEIITLCWWQLVLMTIQVLCVRWEKSGRRSSVRGRKWGWWVDNFQVTTGKRSSPSSSASRVIHTHVLAGVLYHGSFIRHTCFYGRSRELSSCFFQNESTVFVDSEGDRRGCIRGWQQRGDGRILICNGLFIRRRCVINRASCFLIHTRWFLQQKQKQDSSVGKMNSLRFCLRRCIRL